MYETQYDYTFVVWTVKGYLHVKLVTDWLFTSLLSNAKHFTKEMAQQVAKEVNGRVVLLGITYTPTEEI